jgi:hypothetical protein
MNILAFSNFIQSQNIGKQNKPIVLFVSFLNVTYVCLFDGI